MSVETIDRTILPLSRGGASPSVMTEEVVAALLKTETNNEAVRIISSGKSRAATDSAIHYWGKRHGYIVKSRTVNGKTWAWIAGRRPVT